MLYATHIHDQVFPRNGLLQIPNVSISSINAELNIGRSSSVLNEKTAVTVPKKRRERQIEVAFQEEILANIGLNKIIKAIFKDEPSKGTRTIHYMER